MNEIITYINEDERYGDPVEVTVQDYIDLIAYDADVSITCDADGIYVNGAQVASRA